MITDDEEIERQMAENRAAYERLKEQIVERHAGRYVALAFGRIVGSAETYDEAERLVETLTPVPKAYEVFLAGDEPLFDEILDRYTEILPDVAVYADEAELARETPANLRCWREHRGQIRRQQPEGFVAIAEGRLIAVASTFEEAEQVVLSLPRVPSCYLIFGTDREPPVGNPEA